MPPLTWQGGIWGKQKQQGYAVLQGKNQGNHKSGRGIMNYHEVQTILQKWDH